MNHVKLLFYPIVVLVLFLASCSSSGPVREVDHRISLMANSARVAFQAGEYDDAARLYGRALNRAREMDNALEIGNNAYNLAACLIEMGDYARTREMLRESRAAFQREGNVPDGLRILEIKNALAGSALEEAENLLVSIQGGSGDTEISVQYALLRADLALRLDDPDRVRRELKEISDDLGDLEVPTLRAEAERLKGELLLLEGETGKAGSAFDRRVALLREGEQYRAMSVALGRAGEAYRDSGDYCRSLDRFFRSARSLFAQEDPAESLLMIEAALEVAWNCEEETLREQVRKLFNDIKEAVAVLPKTTD
ncbi:MAG: tetratricopeptide repeat protein [Candidatus Auribacterota bacterium]|nr:tetratricopeptide repeat protein [Candidatus Auribacterota bacterium]